MQKKSIFVVFILLVSIFIIYPTENMNAMIVKHNIFNTNYNNHYNTLFWEDSRADSYIDDILPMTINKDSEIEKVTITYIQSDSSISIKINFPYPDFNIKSLGNENYAFINLNDCGFINNLGQAKIPVFRRMLEIPFYSILRITINNVDWEYTSLNEQHMPKRIYPVQPPQLKEQINNDFPVIDEIYYNTDTFFPNTLFSIEEINHIRERRSAIIQVSPIQYNPVSGVLKLMKSCEFTVHIYGGSIYKTINMIKRYTSISFEELFKSLFINYGYYENLAGISRDNEGYLIIVDDQFYDEITPFSNWKSSMGFATTTTNTSEIPGGVSAQNIKNYIKNAYDTWSIPPTYVLLVGDTPQIPAFIGSECGTETDSYYGRMDDDIFPDIYVSRFPASSEDHVNIMVNKTMFYEEGDFSSIDWIKKGVFIASDDMNQLAEDTHEYVIKTHLEPNGYNCTRIYEASGGNTQDIYDALNDGQSLCIYSGHGSPSGWACVPFYISDVYALNNNLMYPFVCSHACSTNTYDDSECFGESWLRAENKGGLAFWGSSCSTYWDEDDIIERRMFDAWWNDSMERIGQMTNKGMYDAYIENPGLQIDKFMESYNVMGDSSVKIWSDNPFIPEHDIALENIQVDSLVPHGETQNVTATVKNVGNNTETSIIVNFIENDIIIDSKIIQIIESMQSTLISFQWNPPIGIYTLEIESQPIPNEYDLDNNNVNKTVSVRASPQISIIPNSLIFMLPTNHIDSDILTILNLPSAEVSLIYNISFSGDYSGNWLSAIPSNGSVEIGQSENVTITVNTLDLIEGVYHGNVIIENNDINDPEVNIPVELFVVYSNDMAALEINSPTGIISQGEHVINATIQNFGYNNQSNVLVNCTIFSGGVPGHLFVDDFSSDPTDWTITSTSGTAWIWDDTDLRMENSYSTSTINTGYLDSPIIDCSGKMGINLSFWHYWKADYSSGNQVGYVRGSINGGDTYPFLIDEFYHNNPGEETAIKTYNLTWANNQENVRIRFDIYNDNDWYWYIDDFNVSSTLSGNITFTSEQTFDIAAYQIKTIEFPDLWNVSLNGLYTIGIETLLDQDQNVANNQVYTLVEVFNDESSPVISNVLAYPNPQIVDGFVNISCHIYDETIIDGVFVDINGPLDFIPINITMNPINGSNVFYYEKNYSIVGNYYFSIYTYDTSGNSVVSNIFSFQILNNSYISVDVYFGLGWNLISIPIDNDWWASDIANNLTGCNSISRWDAVNQTYQTYIVGGPPSFDFVIEPGCGYFVDVNQQSILTMVGDSIISVNIPLKVGWNLIGWYHDYDTSASSLSENITGCTSVSMWNATLQTYNTYIVGGPPSFDFNINCGMGIFVDVTTESIWYG